MGSVENAEKFAESLRTAVRKIEEEIAPDIIKTLASNALNDLVYLTPFDTGYARSGWIVTFDTPSTEVPPEGSSDKSGTATVKAGQATLERAAKFPHIFMSNNVEYIEILDAGRRGDFGVIESPFGEVFAPTRRITGSIQSPNGILTPTFEAMLESITEDRTVE